MGYKLLAAGLAGASGAIAAITTWRAITQAEDHRTRQMIMSAGMLASNVMRMRRGEAFQMGRRGKSGPPMFGTFMALWPLIGLGITLLRMRKKSQGA